MFIQESLRLGKLRCSSSLQCDDCGASKVVPVLDGARERLLGGIMIHHRRWRRRRWSNADIAKNNTNNSSDNHGDNPNAHNAAPTGRAKEVRLTGARQTNSKQRPTVSGVARLLTSLGARSSGGHASSGDPVGDKQRGERLLCASSEVATPMAAVAVERGDGYNNNQHQRRPHQQQHQHQQQQARRPPTIGQLPRELARGGGDGDKNLRRPNRVSGSTRSSVHELDGHSFHPTCSPANQMARLLPVAMTCLLLVAVINSPTACCHVAVPRDHHYQYSLPQRASLLGGLYRPGGDAVTYQRRPQLPIDGINENSSSRFPSHHLDKANSTPSATNINSNGNSTRAHLERANFGQRLIERSNRRPSAKGAPTFHAGDYFLVRTVRQLNGAHDDGRAGSSSANIGRSALLVPAAIGHAKRNYATDGKRSTGSSYQSMASSSSSTSPVQRLNQQRLLSQPTIERRDFISSLIKHYRASKSPTTSPLPSSASFSSTDGPPLDSMWTGTKPAAANVSTQYQVGRSGTLAEPNARLLVATNNTSQRAAFFSSNDRARLLPVQQWLPSTDSAQESLSIGIVIKPDDESSLTSGGTNSSGLTKDYQVVELGEHASKNNQKSRPSLQQLSTGSAAVVDQQQLLDWQASDIEQVIQARRPAVETTSESRDDDDESSGGSSKRQSDANSATSAKGERLKDHEETGHWNREKHGEEREQAAGKKGAKLGADWLKDIGHNRHGWKNVYHKEEYAQHQKFHDLFRDKNWDEKKAKFGQDFGYQKGNKFNESLTKNFYDKDKHGTKYDYSKGNEWRRYEDDDGHYAADDAAGLKASEVVKSRQAEEDGDDAEGNHHSHHPRPDSFKSSSSPIEHYQHRDRHYGAMEPERATSASALHSSGGGGRGPVNNRLATAGRGYNEEPASGGDEAIIEQMKSKLEQLSGQVGASGGASSSQLPPPPDEVVARPATRQSFSDPGKLSFGDQQQQPSSGSAVASKNSQPVASLSGDYESIVDSGPDGGGKALSSSSAHHQSINDILKTARRHQRPYTIDDDRPSSSANGSASVSQRQRGRQEADDTADNRDSDGEGGGESQYGHSSLKDTRGGGGGREKGQLRLKLELDLGKSVGGGSGREDGERRNQTEGNTNNSGGGGASLEDRGRSARFKMASGEDGGGGGSSSWKDQPRRDTGAAWKPSRDSPSGSREGGGGSERQANNHRSPAPRAAPELQTGVGQRFVEPPLLKPTVGGDKSPRHYNTVRVVDSLSSRAKSGAPPVGWRTTQTSFNGGGHHRKQQAASGDSHLRGSGSGRPLRALESLAQVLPSRPIFVKHLQMNGGIVLGKVSGLSPNNQSAASGHGGGGGDDDFSVENLLVGHLHHLHQFDAEQPMSLQAEAPPTLLSPANKEFMIVFGDHHQASEASDAHHQHQLPGREPSVIFEASASSAIDEKLPPPAYLRQSDGHHQQRQRQRQRHQDIGHELASMMSEDHHLTQLMQEDDHDVEFAFRRPPAAAVAQTMMYQMEEGELAARPTFLAATHHNGPNLLKPLLSTMDYGGHYLNAASGSGSMMTPATMQNALERLLRLPARVFSPLHHNNNRQNHYNYANGQQQLMQFQESQPAPSFARWIPSFSGVSGGGAGAGGSFHKPHGAGGVLSMISAPRRPRPNAAHEFNTNINDLMEAAASSISLMRVHPPLSVAQLPRRDSNGLVAASGVNHNGPSTTASNSTNGHQLNTAKGSSSSSSSSNNKSILGSRGIKQTTVLRLPHSLFVPTASVSGGEAAIMTNKPLRSESNYTLDGGGRDFAALTPTRGTPFVARNLVHRIPQSRPSPIESPSIGWNLRASPRLVPFERLLISAPSLSSPPIRGRTLNTKSLGTAAAAESSLMRLVSASAGATRQPAPAPFSAGHTTKRGRQMGGKIGGQNKSSRWAANGQLPAASTSSILARNRLLPPTLVLTQPSPINQGLTNSTTSKVPSPPFGQRILDNLRSMTKGSSRGGTSAKFQVQDGSLFSH